MKSRTIKQVEAATLKTFTEEIPSIYFSDKTEAEFETYSHNAEITYRDLLKFPPKMFQGADLIDFGAGTGENTVSLARWGANCTLVEMNANAIAISKKVFSKYAPNSAAKFVQSSIFDFDSNLKFDIVHCRGVLAHTADKEGAFRKIAGFMKPGAFLIFGDPNKAGGFQNMLQRYAIYRNASTPDEMVAAAEMLFKEDIDRSQSFVNRTRRAIVFDRWVIQSQDDPSVDEVIAWLSEAELTLYSAYPAFVLPVFGDSVHHRPKFDAARVPGIGAIAETIWMLQNRGDSENASMLDDSYMQYSQNFAKLTSSIANLNSNSSIDRQHFTALLSDTSASFSNLTIFHPLQKRLVEFLGEVTHFIELVDTNDLDTLRAYILSTKHLFKGMCGVRHVDFIAYKGLPK